MQRIVQYDKMPRSLSADTGESGGRQTHLSAQKNFFCRASWSWPRCAANGSARARRRPRRRTLPLTALQSDREYQELLHTACVYLLDCDSSVTRTAQPLFLHTNTIKYRLQRISDLLGYRLGKMPETIELYRSAAIYRLLHEPHEHRNKHASVHCPFGQCTEAFFLPIRQYSFAICSDIIVPFFDASKRFLRREELFP